MRRCVVLAWLLTMLVACGTDPVAPRPLSTEEAERLALIRFNNYEAGTVGVKVRIPATGGALLLDGRVDFADHLGYATLRTEGRTDPASAGLLQWRRDVLAFRAGQSELREQPPPDGWQLRKMVAKGSELDAVLRLLVNLGADRPDNAQLLQQSSARWLRSDTVSGVAIDVFDGPKDPSAPSADTARLRYWVDNDGRLRRVEATLGDRSEPATVDLTEGGGEIPVLPQIAG